MQDKITNNEVLQRAKMDGMEAMLVRAQLRWVGHMQRISDNRMPKQIFYSELSSGARSRGGKKAIQRHPEANLKDDRY